MRKQIEITIHKCDWINIITKYFFIISEKCKSIIIGFGTKVSEYE